MTWAPFSGATVTAVVVPAGVGLAAVLAWLITDISPGDAPELPAMEREQAAPQAQLEYDLDPVSVEQGRVYYAQLCIPCHGVRGDGLGEWAYRVVPRPANLTDSRTRKRSDTQLYEIISEGLRGTAMIGWKRQLSEAQRRLLVVYVRSLSRAGSGKVQHE
ncbi:MAG TPA: c-type cytochrome [Burkholderiales bacterium]|nr:c-type cytochrome [Burkholderiales bacterium]